MLFMVLGRTVLEVFLIFIPGALQQYKPIFMGILVKGTILYSARRSKRFGCSILKERLNYSNKIKKKKTFVPVPRRLRRFTQNSVETARFHKSFSQGNQTKGICQDMCPMTTDYQILIIQKSVQKNVFLEKSMRDE